jgi:hypothetical protein
MVTSEFKNFSKTPERNKEFRGVLLPQNDQDYSIESLIPQLAPQE